MSKIWYVLLAAALLVAPRVNAQNFQFSGVVIDSISQKAVEGVAIQVLPELGSKQDIFAVTNVNGKFMFTLPAGNYTVNLSIIGYAPVQEQLKISGNTDVTIVVVQRPFPLGEVMVSSFRVNRSIKQLPTPLAVVGKYDYQHQSAFTLSHVLDNEPGITKGSDGVWATNVNIRGFGENRLVTLVDGFRVETANDLTASLSMIDVNDVERVEVVKGAQSVLYGTGAMGGIVNVITKDGHFASKNYVSGNLITSFATVNNNYAGYANVNAGGSNWYVKLNGTYTDAQNIMTPAGELPNSQFTANNAAAKIGFKPLKNHTLKAQYQRYQATDVGIPGGSAFPGPAKANYKDIGRQLISASYEITDITPVFSSVKLSYFNQHILRDVLLYPNAPATQTTLPNGNTQITTPQYFTPLGIHDTQGLQLQTSWSFADNNTFIAGVDAWQRELFTERQKYIKAEVFNPVGDLITTNNMVRGETPIPNATFGTVGVFAQNESHFFEDRMTLILGARADAIRTQNEQAFDIDYLIVNGNRNDTPPNQRETFAAGTHNLFSWSANAGVLYSVAKDIDLSASYARSFRAPSLEESYKFIDLGNFVQLGDPTLKPESGHGVDLGLRIWKPNFTLQFSLFSNWINNMIVETPGEYIYTYYTGPNTGVTDTLPALINANVSKAMLYGTDIKFQYRITRGLVAFGSGAVVVGKDTEKDTYLPQIPPLSGRAGARYTFTKAGAFELSVMGAAKQDKIAAGETTTDGYYRLDFNYGSPKFNLGFSNLQLFAGIDNITNNSYTNHLSTNRGSISIEPGRNFYVRASLTF